MNVILFYVAIFSVLILNASLAAAETTDRYYYEPNMSQLSGHVEWQKYRDAQPPFFGEGKDGEGNLAPEVNVLVLIPDRPINVTATAQTGPDEDSYSNVEIIEIDVVYARSIERYLGRRVTVSGYLYERQTGFEYTDVLLDPKSVTPLPH